MNKTKTEGMGLKEKQRKTKTPRHGQEKTEIQSAHVKQTTKYQPPGINFLGLF